MNIGWTAHANTRPAHIKVAMPGLLPLFCSNWRQINQSNANIKTDLSKKLWIHLKKCEQGTKAWIKQKPSQRADVSRPNPRELASTIVQQHNQDYIEQVNPRGSSLVTTKKTLKPKHGRQCDANFSNCQIWNYMYSVPHEESRKIATMRDFTSNHRNTIDHTT